MMAPRRADDGSPGGAASTTAAARTISTCDDTARTSTPANAAQATSTRKTIRSPCAHRSMRGAGAAASTVAGTESASESRRRSTAASGPGTRISPSSHPDAPKTTASAAASRSRAGSVTRAALLPASECGTNRPAVRPP